VPIRPISQSNRVTTTVMPVILVSFLSYDRCKDGMLDSCFFTSYCVAWSTTNGSVSTLHLIAGLVFVLN